MDRHYFWRIIKVVLNLYTILFFMHEQNTSRFNIITSKKRYRQRRFKLSSILGHNTSGYGWKHTKHPPPPSPQIVVTLIIFMWLIFWWCMDITSWILLFFSKVYLISFRLHLINYFEKFNKHWRFWTYGVYLW
jgi:hypothetical protein